MRTLQEEYLQKLKQIQDSYSPNLVMIPGDEPRFIIDANKRTITIPDEFPFLGVLKDTRAETIFFEIDRYFDEHDLSTKTCVVQFYGMSEDEGSFSGIYPVTDLDVDSVEGKIVFGWTITDDVTSIAGDVKFAIRFYTIETDEEETPYFDFCFNTLTSELPVMNTLDVSQDVSGKVDPSILDEWNVKMQDLYSKTKSLANNFDNFNEEVNLAKQEIQKSGQNSVDEILTNKTSAIEEIKKETSSEKESAIESITNASNAEQEKIKSVFPEIGEDDDGKILGVLDGKLVLTQMKNDIKPGEGLVFDEETNTMRVDVENDVVEDSTKPISSAAVYRSIGNISAILSSI